MVEPRPPSITIGLAAHHQFCPRRAWLEAAGEQTGTRQMAIGTAAHERTDDASTARSHQLRSVDVYGDRIQYSVFVADCRPARLVRLRSAIAEIITRDTDSVLLCDLGPVHAVNPSTFSYVGVTRTITPHDTVIV